MSEWDVRPLGEVATVVSGSTPKTSVEEYWGGQLCWVTPAEIADTDVVITETRRKITKKAIHDTSLSPLPVGTVLLSSRAPIGKVAITGKEMYCNQGFKNLICSNKVFNKYLFWFLKGKTEFLDSLGRGATFKEISKGIVERILIPLPPLETQRKIAKTLDTVSEMLALRKQQLADLDNLIKSTFYDMFGDPVANEKGWDIVKYNNLLTEKPKNGFFAKKEEYLADGNSKVIWISDFIDKMSCDLTNLKRVNATDNDVTNYQVTYGDMLFCRSSLTKPGIGKCAYVPSNVQDNTLFECHIIKTKIDLRRVNPIFLQVQTTTDFFRNQVISHSKTSTMTTIGQAGIVNNCVILPPIPYQTRYADVVTEIEEQKLPIIKSVEEIQLLLDSLMSKYFS